MTHRPLFGMLPAVLLLCTIPLTASGEQPSANSGGKAIEPQLVNIPAGRFKMGCVEGKDCYNDEKPVRTVRVAAFQMGKHEVTFDEWDACVADRGCTYRPDDEGWGRGQRPVIVSWDDAQTYIAWLNQKTGKSYRLPSEAEWEYAARAGTTTRFSTGDCISAEQANFNGEQQPVAGCSKGERRGKTVEVGSFAANPWGLFDMHGNVAEWTQDCWNLGYRGAPSDSSARSEGFCDRSSVRGGAWLNTGKKVRVASRQGFPRNSRLTVGFRLARSK